MSIIPPIALYHLSVVVLCFFASCSKIVYQSNQQERDNTKHPQSESVDKQELETQDDSACLVCFNEIPIRERLVFCPNVKKARILS